MELSDLIGKHILTGVDLGEEAVTDEYRSGKIANTVHFVLDGITYAAVEDPDDGYRSHMKDLVPSAHTVKNTFPPVTVLGSMKEPGEYQNRHDVLILRDIRNGKVILEVGTADTDDYYPYFVGMWRPENLSLNEESQS